MAALAPTENVSLGQDIDPNASPVGSIDTNTTPDTEFSPPESPIQRSGPPKDVRTLARNKLDTLTQEEKVCCSETLFLRSQRLTLNRCPC
jgi:beta-glucosidase